MIQSDQIIPQNVLAFYKFYCTEILVKRGKYICIHFVQYKFYFIYFDEYVTSTSQ